MSKKIFPVSQIPIRKTVELLPRVFQTETNDKFLSSTLDALTQPGTLEKTVGYIGKRYGKTYKGSDVYIDTDETLRSRYQLEVGVTVKSDDKIQAFYDYLDFKNQIKFFGNEDEKDDKITEQVHYSWNPPIDWDKFVNYREYYWEALCPPPVTVLGQTSTIESTYSVKLGVGSTYIFTPDAFTNNPTITLYRGQTYKFKINAPYEGLLIRTNYDTGSLLYNPILPYAPGSLVVFDNKLWRARVAISPDGSTIDLDSENWEFIDEVSGASVLNYDQGITNNGIENGILTFEVPYDAPDVLFYQSKINPDRFGKFIIANIEESTKINIELEVLGKESYTSSNGIVFTNGLVVEFIGQVTPSIYSHGSWLVEGVGTAITLTNVQGLVPTGIQNAEEEVVFDGSGFDMQPFDDATEVAKYKDYITIARDSGDNNPWSRYNRWFHRSVLEYAYKLRGQDFTADESVRARRPIIEFTKSIKLYNHGFRSKTPVDFIDKFTTDVFSKIEGSLGFTVEGEPLFDGARLLIIADEDSLVNNKIYKVKFIQHNNRRQISLIPTEDSDPIEGESVLVRRGNLPQASGNRGLMYHYDGSQWKLSQRKTKVNQSPLFNAFDEQGISFSDLDKYPNSSFAGTKILSYKLGNGPKDTELGFPISYLNIDNVGDIQFDWNWEQDKFDYSIDRVPYSINVKTGYYQLFNDNSFANGWTTLNEKFNQPIVDSLTIDEQTNSINLYTVNWDYFDEKTSIVNFYLNGRKLSSPYTRNRETFTFETSFQKDDIVSIKIITELPPDQGYYEIPLGLEKNPLNNDLQTFTLGQAVDHISSAIEFNFDFKGKLPGVSNLRDISGYQNYANRFLKHSFPAPMGLALTCDKEINVIKSIQFAKKSYTEFKNAFLTLAAELEYPGNPVDFVDDIIEAWSKTKNSASPYSSSDMIGSGAYTTISYEVEDEGITTYALSEKFTLNELSKRAVYVYINKKQLINEKDYVFDNNFGFVRILHPLVEKDLVEIREYVSTAFNYIPPTPTSLGLYKKYTPFKFVDDTYQSPKEVIQGHDGSLIDTFGDYRDDAILELEFRIYNNIKSKYDYQFNDTDKIAGGYFGNSVYDKSQIDKIVTQEFLKWVQNTNINYIDNGFYDSENAFTYTYNRMTDPTQTRRLPGYWRGVYHWFFDTDKPHTRPWEMLGFSEKPDWWEEEYGAPPYTNQNLLLWEDLRDGVIRQGPRAGRYERYQRPSLLSHIPVNDSGELINPLASNVATNFSLINNSGPFALGDEGPVEYAWRVTSEWPFAFTIAMCLLRPFEFISRNYDNSKSKFNKIGQVISNKTNSFVKIEDLVSNENSSLSSGIVQYIRAYLRSKEISTSVLDNKLLGIDVNLSHRLSGFVDKDQQKYLLDSKSPKSSTSSIFIPGENYDIIFNVSAPIFSLSYSGVVIEKTNKGWILRGYDDLKPYFNYFEAVPSQKDPLIQVGGISEQFKDWSSDTLYSNGQLIRYRTDFYRAIKTHTSTETFEIVNWKKVPKVPLVGSVDAYRRRAFNEMFVKQLYYGTVLTKIQDVVDFLLGYEQYLKSQGFIFDGYDRDLAQSYDWTTSCKEFMFWTRQNWADGSIIALSPISKKIAVTIPIGVSDNLLDGFYEYRILRDDGQILSPDLINVYREFQSLTLSTNANTTDGIYFFRTHYVLKEHVTVFEDRTVFNDIIYDKTTGYRQERMRVQGYRTVDWDGDYTSPGFLFDNVNIQVWQPFKDYRLGDIVAYRSYNWTSLENQVGVETFDDTKWTKLDSKPEKQLIANFDYRINQIDDYYDVASEGLGASQRMLARHAIGYQTRDYLQNMAEDQVTQFRIYQGFIREKGTKNAITKVFDKLSRSGTDSIKLNEEWAFRIGRMGGIDEFQELEMELAKDNFKLNPQNIVVLPTGNTANQNYNINQSNFTRFFNGTFTRNINKTSLEEEPKHTPGYVKLDQVEHIVSSRDALLEYDITKVKENDHIWITFDKTSWTVLRFNESPILTIEEIIKDGTTFTITTARRHNLEVGDIVGIDVENLKGFFKVTNNELASTLNTFQIVNTATGPDPKLSTKIANNLRILTPVRFGNYNDIDEESAALLKNNSRLWIDNNGDGTWEVIKKKKQYSSKTISESGIAVPKSLGTKVVYNESLKQSFVSDPGSGVVLIYSEVGNNLNVKQVVTPPFGLDSAVKNSFGNEISISPDNRFLVISAPKASGIPSNFKGDLDKVLFDDGDNDPLTNPPPFADLDIFPNDIYLYRGKLWRAKTAQNIIFDGSTKIDVYTEDWEPAEFIPMNITGTNPGYEQQGVIFIYEYRNLQWEFRNALLSPRPSPGEEFGSKVTIGSNGLDYYMAVSAVGSLQNTGRVYLFNYQQNQSAVESFFGSLCNYNTNTIDFGDPHSYFTGQKVFYFNGTPDGVNVSTQDQPPPPEDNTEFYVIAVDTLRIQLASSIQDARDNLPINLLDIGIDDSSSHTLIREVRQSEWKILENHNYRGIYGEIPRSPTYGSLSLQPAFYPKGSIVYSNGKLWEAQTDTFEDGSTLSIESNDWLEVSNISTSCSLPFNLYLGNDHSTLAQGLLEENQYSELVKEGDSFGTSLAMSRDGSILAVGAPLSDGQYFVNYKGIWRPDVEYVEGQVVKYFDDDLTNSWGYYRLVDDRADQTVDSTVRSYGVKPGDHSSANGFLWDRIGDSTDESVGKVYIYQRNDGGVYKLRQTITSANLADLNDLVEDININVGDEFGYAIDLDYSGTTLVVTSPKADKNFTNQGSVYVFNTNGLANVNYRLKQKLASFEVYPNEYFGQDVSISPYTEKIVVGAKNTKYSLPTILNTYQDYVDARDNGAYYAEYIPATEELAISPTIFDQGKTKFIDQPGFAGAVYVFELKDTKYFLTEKIDTQLSPNESFGNSVDCGSNAILVGSPGYIQPAPHLAILAYDGPITGTARLFTKKEGVSSWEVLTTRSPVVEISKIQSISLYDAEKDVKIQDIDFIDPAKLKILAAAEQEIQYKTPYDPAIYNVGTEEKIIDPSLSWAEKHVGEVWWDTSKAKWLYYEQGDLDYRSGNWGTLAEGAEIVVCEWVETVFLPSEWAALADTNEGLAAGISGQPLHPNDDVYTIKELFNTTTGETTGTKYFYWVKGKVTLPETSNRKLSLANITSYISNPLGSGNAFIAFTSSNSIAAYNFNSVISSDKFYLNIQKFKNRTEANETHNEYFLMTENVASSIPPEKLEVKWIDSLIGYDQAGNRIPDPYLHPKQKYGIEYRPRQGMFVDRLLALRIAIDRINLILQDQPFADLIDFAILNSKDEAPSEVLREYDQIVDTYNDLSTVGVTRLKPGVLRANIINGQIESIDVIDGGFGYKSKEIYDQQRGLFKGPPVEIEGNGTGASAISLINSQGIITEVIVIFKGKKYSTANAKVRNFSVLVVNDETLNNFWSIYSWDSTRKSFFRTRSQAFNTSRYWTYADWWKTGYSDNDRIVREISNISLEPSIKVLVGDLIRIKEYSNGGWAIFEKISDTGIEFTDRYQLVGRQQGTIRFLESLYDPSIEGVGYDNTQTFDTAFYDIDNSKELRNIFRAVKENIFINEYDIEWNRLFFTCLRQVFSEQDYVDWAFKTSFLKASHSVGELEEKFNYKNDNLSSYQEYIDEVKPYRTTVREYLSKYNKTDVQNAGTTDFDLPPTYSSVTNTIINVSPRNSIITDYPWKWWSDNKGYSVVSIQVYDGGSGYTTIPKVSVDGDGVGATARAFISNGIVSGIEVLTRGSGFTQAPNVTIIGGTLERQAKAAVILGDGKARTFNLKIKFDRITKDGSVKNYNYTQTFIASGFTSVFELNYAPTFDKSQITVYKNDQIVLSSDFNISLFISELESYSLLKGKISFNTVPDKDDRIVVSYEKNSELFDAVSRINKFYAPAAGMANKEPSQLMTGIDFGGVQIQGTTFDVTGGWDALPWFTDNWDSVEASADYYHVCDGDTLDVTLPYTPADGQEINIYIKRLGNYKPGSYDTNEITGRVTYSGEIAEPPAIRIDDPFYNQLDDSSTSANPNAEMPTFIGDGITNTLEIGRYIQTFAGDILIFRPVESDGSVTITDTNLLDTKLSGGSLESTTTGQQVANNTINGIYTTARGIAAEEILIDGEKFVSPDQVPAPEENVPGQVLDSLSIRVFQSSISSVAPVQTRILYGDGVTQIFDIKATIFESKSLRVYVNKVLCDTENTDSTLLYSINFRTNQIEFFNPPPLYSIIEIISIGIGGVSILDYQEQVVDGNENRFLTAANYSSTTAVVTTVNGIATDSGFLNSSEVQGLPAGKTLVEFGQSPPRLARVKILVLGANPNTDITKLTLVRLNNQVSLYDGSTRSIEIENFQNLNRASANSSFIVELNGRYLRGVDTNYYVIEDKYLTIVSTFIGFETVYELSIGTDPSQPPGSILANNLKVFFNDSLAEFITDYVYDGVTKKIIINQEKLNTGDIVKIENDLESEYDIINNNLVVRSTVSLDENDILDITWFDEYPSMKIIADEFIGGKVVYKLPISPVSATYVWVYKNGTRLTQDVDYTVSLPRSTVNFVVHSTQQDIIKIIVFGSSIFRLPSGFEIYKDMLNIYQFKRWSVNEVELVKDLNYFDNEMEVNDASELAEPILTKNIPGVVYINGERIEYLQKNGNILKQLRRGSYGTPIGVLHASGSKVVDVGPNDTLPYNEEQSRNDFVSDGSTLIVGSLDFVPQLADKSRWYASGLYRDRGVFDINTSYSTKDLVSYNSSYYVNVKPSQGVLPNDTATSLWEPITIPENYGPCDMIEVFVAGRRLRKNPASMYEEEISSSSVDGDKVVEAEFTVDGESPTIRLTKPVPAGTRISVIRKLGKIWKDRGTTTIQSGASLLDNNTPVAKFIAQKSTKLPE